MYQNSMCLQYTHLDEYDEVDEREHLELLLLSELRAEEFDLRQFLQNNKLKIGIRFIKYLTTFHF